jgi:hypothetical protein
MFQKVLPLWFESRAGNDRVQAGLYMLLSSKEPYGIINQENWHIIMKPGTSITMSLMFRKKTKNPNTSCPSCGKHSTISTSGLAYW